MTEYETTKTRNSTMSDLFHRIAEIEAENAFYREQLEIIAKDKRKTKARRLAESALNFRDEMLRQKAKTQENNSQHVHQMRSGECTRQ